MNKQIWNSGPPPSLGWWPASATQSVDVYRWWNGNLWSCPAYEMDSKKQAQQLANMPACEIGIEWKHRPTNWPKRSMT